MLGAIKDVDLIAAELKKYGKCYREYTRILSETNNKEEIKESKPVYEKGIFNLFVGQLKTKLLTKGNVCQLTPS